MKQKLSMGQVVLAWINIIVGTGTALLGLWAFLATLTDWDLKMSCYYLFAIAFGAFFVWSGARKIRGQHLKPSQTASEVDHETP